VHRSFHCRLGVTFWSAMVTMDRGTQFTTELWAATCSRLGMKHFLTTVYHPQSNRMVERVHRHIRDALRARGAGAEWHGHLPWVLKGLCAVSKEESAISSAELVLRAPIVLPGQLLHMPELPLLTYLLHSWCTCGLVASNSHCRPPMPAPSRLWRGEPRSSWSR
jgi:transposase InsO family protein